MYYNYKEDRIELSVRELCALAHRGGSLDTRMPPAHLYDLAREGREVHKKLQSSRGDGYYAEVPLKNTCRCGDVNFYVTGRADGVIYHPDGECIVEEIKMVSGADRYLRMPRETDLAQLSCYGYFLSCIKGLSSVTLRLTYARAGEGEEEGHVDSVLSAERLRDAYVSMLAVILPRAKDLIERETTVRREAKEALFPYPEMRAEQEDMIRECWRDLRHGQTVFAQAPTGIGKTISTLYPAVRCLGERKCDKIFYLTAKTSTRREAVGAVERMIEAGTHLRACVIASRESMCACESARASGGRLSRHCNPDACPYAKGYYDRAEGVISQLLNNGNGILTPRTVREAAIQHTVCPYELTLDLSERCEIVIADYNYVFSPTVYLRRYFADGVPNTEGHEYIFLVDEAHNLADRARDMYAGQLSLADVVAVQDALAAYESAEREAYRHAVFPEEDHPSPDGGFSAAVLDDLVGTLIRQGHVCDENAVTDAEGVRRGVSLERQAPITLIETVSTIGKRCDTWLRRHPDHPLYDTVDALSAILSSFRTAGDYYDERFATFTEIEGEDVRVRLVCLDPAGVLAPILNKARAKVLFSATLTPTEYFANILGGDKDSVKVSFESPFDPDRLCVSVVDHVSTRYEDRDASVRQVVSYIAATVSAKAGNYMVYLPSYSYLDKVYALFTRKYPKVKTVLQRAGMTAQEREDFIAAFKPDSKKLQIGFCVLGGSFSEGVDLPGNALIGVVVVGVGLPGLSSEGNIVRDYYDERLGGETAGEGYAYAYTYPGMNRVLQAVGRVIRRPEDLGVAVLIDDRYMTSPYLSLYPDHWVNMSAVGDPHSLAEHLHRFWQEFDEEMQDF